MNGYSIISSLLEGTTDFRVGDTVLVGRFKNRKAIVKGFKRDKNNQPQILTTKGTYSLYRFRIKKLMPKKNEN